MFALHAPLRVWFQTSRRTSQYLRNHLCNARSFGSRYCASRAVVHRWADLATQRQAFDDLGSYLRHSSLEDWYKVDTKTIRMSRCQYILAQYYNESIHSALSAIYAEHVWQPWKFKQVPRNFWAQSANCRQYLDWLGALLGFATLDEWYQLSANDIRNNNGMATALLPSSLSNV